MVDSNLKHTAINLPNLTPLRAFAAIAVVYFHFNEIFVQFVSPEKTMLLRKCYLMVDLFFIMSGFIMLHVYGESFSKALHWESFRKFIKARFARLYPLHLFTLTIAVLMFYLSNAPVIPIEARINNPMAIPTHLLLLQSFGFHDIFTWNVPSWSISAEWWAYMVFPFLALLLARNKRIGIILITLLIITIYFSILYLVPKTNVFVPTLPNLNHDLDVTFDYGYLRGLAGFMTGMIAYTMYQNKTIIRFLAKDIVCFIVIVVLLILMHFGLNDLIYIPLFLLLVLCFSKNESIIHKICNLKPLQYIGDISYSIYMIHTFIIFSFGPFIIQKMGYTFSGQAMPKMPFYSGILASTLLLFVVIIVSSITYFLIERPCRNWINKKFK